MKIAVVGAGAMGSIYGAYLSQYNEVYLVGKSALLADKIQREGLRIRYAEVDTLFYPHIVLTSGDIGPVDLFILFVKASSSEKALQDNQQLIGSKTYVMTLQNGSGHEELLKKYADIDRIIIGTTEDSGTIVDSGVVLRGGTGDTNVGILGDDKNKFLPLLKKEFERCGFNVSIHKNVQQLIWNKLFINASLSVVTSILQVNMGYVARDTYAWSLVVSLIKEAVTVAKAIGLEADENTITEKVKSIANMTPNGYPSIMVDLRAGKKTEVDCISGSILRTATRMGIAVPTTAFVINMVHALEGCFCYTDVGKRKGTQSATDKNSLHRHADIK